MKDKEEFYNLLGEIDGKDFADYARIIGDFDFSRYIVKFNRLPTESEGTAVLFVVRVPQSVAGFPPHLHSTPIRRTALEAAEDRQGDPEAKAPGERGGQVALQDLIAQFPERLRVAMLITRQAVSLQGLGIVAGLEVRIGNALVSHDERAVRLEHLLEIRLGLGVEAVDV